MIWEDMVEDSAKLPGPHSVAIFSASRKIKKRADSPGKERSHGSGLSGSNLSPCPLPIGIAQPALEDLAGVFTRQLVLDFDVFRHLVIGQGSLQLRADRGSIERHAGP